MLYVALVLILAIVTILLSKRLLGGDLLWGVKETLESASEPPPADDIRPSEIKSNRISDLDSQLVFFNHSAYDKIPVTPEPNLSGVTLSEVSAGRIVELSPIAGKQNVVNTTSTIDRLE